MASPVVSTLILASTSSIRQKLLADAGLDFSIAAPAVDEVALRKELERAGITEPADIAQALAGAKARDVSARHPGALVIGADQVLSIGDEIMTKAADVPEARTKLQSLRGRWHTLISALATARNGDVTWRHVEYAKLHVRDFSDEWLEHYLRNAGEALTRSVGAYRLEEIGVQLFDETKGDYFAVLGLPMVALLNRLRMVGLLMA
jgi:septum formation protein